MGTRYGVAAAMQATAEERDAEEGKLRLWKWRKLAGLFEDAQEPLKSMSVLVPTWWPYGDLTSQEFSLQREAAALYYAMGIVPQLKNAASADAVTTGRARSDHHKVATLNPRA